jgi:hypothetical protein
LQKCGGVLVSRTQEKETPLILGFREERGDIGTYSTSGK